MTRRTKIETKPNAKEDGAKVFWKSLEERNDPEGAARQKAAEFPFGMAPSQNALGKGDAILAKDVGRRGFLKFGAVAAAALGAEACVRRPVEKLVPYTRAPEYTIPGVASHYATTIESNGEALGLIVECHEGRPTKVEGNVDHPTSRGAANLQAQAEVWNLYDPDRSKSPRQGSEPRSVDDWRRAAADLGHAHEGDGGAKLAFLLAPTTSTGGIALLGDVKQRFPKARFFVYAAVHALSAVKGAEIAFGQPLQPVYDYERARTIVSLDSDFLQTEPGNVAAMRRFSQGRRLRDSAGRMNRLYVVEPTLSVTGANADKRLRMPAADVERFARLLAKELASSGGLALGAVAGALGDVAPSATVPDAFVKAVAKELGQNRGASLIVAGQKQPPSVHALALALNHALANVGQTLTFAPAPFAALDKIGDAVARDSAAGQADEMVRQLGQAFPLPENAPPGGNAPKTVDPLASLTALGAALDGNQIDTLVIVGGNPAYDAPVDFRFAERVKKAKVSMHLSSHDDETSELVTWHVGRSHPFEAWDVRASLVGTLAVQQPLIAPLWGSVSDLEFLSSFTKPGFRSSYAIVREHLRTTLSGDRRGKDVWSPGMPAMPSMAPLTVLPPATEPKWNDDIAWNKALQRGVVASSLFVPPMAPTTVKSDDVAAAIKAAPLKPSPSKEAIEIVFSPDPKLGDGRHANNNWLLEMPDPMTKIVWDNAALLSAKTAEALGVKSRDLVTIQTSKGSIQLAAWILPGHADWSITLPLGWGRKKAGRYGSGKGFDVTPIRASDGFYFAAGAKVTAAGGDYNVTLTQDHHSMEGRAIAIDTTLEKYRENPDYSEFRSLRPKTLPLWNRQNYETGHKWGMVIDLNACTGCNACVVACYAENNIAIVGKTEVGHGREMAWLRIDRYFIEQDPDHPSTSADEPLVAIQPVACVQCEEAPCENVCPVNATEHSPEGLNDMAYNRCVGTRYCANNCPYKVRRFNYLEFQGEPLYGDIPETTKMQFNPNVTVRMRGVMEKCTYCVQRIEEGKINARRTGKALKDGEIQTACQQTCPASAIVFGDLNDPKSRVADLAKVDRGYELLSEIGTHPRTTYLGKVRNPNKEIA